MTPRTLGTLGALLALAVPLPGARAEAAAAPDATGTALETAFSPVASCACHDALGPRTGTAPLVDLRGWAADGPHRPLGCVGCHPGADVTPHPPSALAPPDCAGCHAEQAKDFAETVHGRTGGDPRLRGCLTCHAEHSIVGPDAPEARWTNTGLLYSCAACHAPMALRAGFDLPLGPPPAGGWPSSTHGLVVDGDKRSVAACGSCHGIHQVFPSSDPRSTLSAANVVATCGACHTGVGPETAHGGVKSALPVVVTEFFDVWYYWAGGTVALTLLGIVGALVAGAILRRGQAPKTKHP